MVVGFVLTSFLLVYSLFQCANHKSRSDSDRKPGGRTEKTLAVDTAGVKLVPTPLSEDMRKVYKKARKAGKTGSVDDDDSFTEGDDTMKSVLSLNTEPDTAASFATVATVPCTPISGTA